METIDKAISVKPYTIRRVPCEDHTISFFIKRIAASTFEDIARSKYELSEKCERKNERGLEKVPEETVGVPRYVLNKDNLLKICVCYIFILRAHDMSLH